MLRKRVLLLAVIQLLAVLLLAMPTAFAQGLNMSIYPTLGGNTGLYTGNVGNTVALQISYSSADVFNNVPWTSKSLVLTLPSTVSIGSVSGATQNGNTLTSLSGNPVTVTLNMNSASYRYPNSQYRADRLSIQYKVTYSNGQTYSQNASLDIAVRSSGDTSSSAVSSNSSVYPSTYYPNYSYYPYYTYDYDCDDYYYPNSPSISYGSNGFWAGGSYYPYGSYYNGYYYYGRNQYYTYNPYSSLNNYYGLSLDQSNLTLGIGSSHQFKVSVGAYGSAYGISWSSSNAQVAAVDSSGLVTGLTNGTATITARGTYGTTATCTVNVGYGNSVTTVVPSVDSNATVTSLKFGKVKTKLTVGEAVQMYINIQPTTVNYGNTQIVSTDTSVLQVREGGIVTAVGAGTASVYFAFGGKTAMQTFTVK